MATAQAIQISITHTSLGILTGAFIETMMPAHAASSSTAAIAFEAFVQVGLNAVLLSQVGGWIQTANDPTYGFLFQLGLFEAQPGLMKRIDFLGDLAKQQVAQAVQKMAPPAPEQAPANPGY